MEFVTHQNVNEFATNARMKIDTKDLAKELIELFVHSWPLSILSKVELDD